jgi:hypothetical protein
MGMEIVVLLQDRAQENKLRFADSSKDAPIPDHNGVPCINLPKRLLCVD